MITFFVLGGLWFWLLVVIATILLIAAIEKDSPGWAALTIFATLTLLFFGGLRTELSEIFSWIWHNPGSFIGIFLGYLVLGTVWAIIKWYWFLLELKRKNQEEKKKKIWGVGNLARDNKSKIINWMMYWPFSLIWTGLNDPFQAIYRRLTGTFQAMANKVLKEEAKAEEAE